MSRLDKFDRAKASRLALDLMGAFCWGDTPDGHEYWKAVHEKLAKLGKEPDVCRTCNQIIPH